jgi:hypothetical protein
MKFLAILIMLAALWLLYRIAYPKRQEAKRGGDAPKKRRIDPSEVVVKSSFVRPSVGQPRTTTATSVKADSQMEKADIFAAANEKRDAAIPPERLDDAFSEEPDPNDLDIEPDENEVGAQTDIEEAEALRQMLGRNAGFAGGLSIEQMDEVVEATRNPTDEKADLLYKIEKTDMFEKLVSGDVVKSQRITAIIERHVRNLYPEDGGDESDGSDPVDFDVAEFLS